MKFPDALGSTQLSALPDFAWNSVLFNTFWSVNDEDNPRLIAALQLISTKAAFSLAVGFCEWVLARVNGRTNVLDSQLRIQAGWAAAVDPLYAKLPFPPDPPAAEPYQFASPLRLAMDLLAYSHECLLGGGFGVRSTAQGLAMQVDHLVGNHPAFVSWLAEALRRCNAHYPATEAALDEQKPVPQEFFEPNFTWSDANVDSAINNFLKKLDPATNPYLRSPAEMLADGFNGQPYGRP